MLLQSPIAEFAMPMTELDLVVEFHCGICEGPVAATLHCEGNLDELDGYPRVPIGCPHCTRTNDVTFDSEGAVHDVVARPRPLTEPIWN
jgi:hypothetical protein